MAVVTFHELMRDGEVRVYESWPVHLDPFEQVEHDTYRSVFGQATLHSVCYLTVPSALGILVDMRTAEFRFPNEINTGLIVLRSVRTLSMTAHPWLLDFAFSSDSEGIDIQVSDAIHGTGSILAHGKSAEIYLGVVAGIGSVAAPLGDDRGKNDEFFRTTPTWSSQMRIVYAYGK